MLCEKIIGNINDEKFKNLDIDYVDIEWHEAFKKIHKKTSHNGVEVGIRLGNDILKRGLNSGDVLYADDKTVLAVNIPECDVIVVKAENECLIPKICYEIGNRHATLFYGENDNEFITPYNQPMLDMLSKIHRHVNGTVYRATAEKRVLKLDFDKAISSSVNNHTH